MLYPVLSKISTVCVAKEFNIDYHCVRGNEEEGIESNSEPYATRPSSSEESLSFSSFKGIGTPACLSFNNIISSYIIG